MNKYTLYGESVRPWNSSHFKTVLIIFCWEICISVDDLAKTHVIRSS